MLGYSTNATMMTLPVTQTRPNQIVNLVPQAMQQMQQMQQVQQNQLVTLSPAYQPAAPTRPALAPTQPARYDYCSQFNVACVQPEPYASSIDIITASQKIEEAIHASNIKEMQNYMNQAKKYLQYAQNYFKTAGLADMVDYAGRVIDTLDTLGAESTVLRRKNLQQFQEQRLYGYMGILSAFYKRTNALRV